MSDFYIGYLPKMPSHTRRLLRRAVIGLLSIALLAAVVLVLGQHPFAKSAFEFSEVRIFEGVIEANPYPALLLQRPGLSEAQQQFSRYLLVGVGKHGVDLTRFNGMNVELKGKLIYRSEQTIIEVMPDSVRSKSAKVAPTSTRHTVNNVTVRGEILDSKCHSGVMNPGEGKVHRDCAVRCLSGGVPPVLVEQEQPNRVFILTDADGNKLDPSTFLDKVAEPVIINGAVTTTGDQVELRVRDINRQ